VRVIAGTAKGRRLRAASATRPTADSVKEALFSSLGPRVAGARVLDLYAGSGALGIEALSRGAGTVTFVEEDARAAAVIRQNLDATGLSDRGRVVEETVERFLASDGTERFDVVLADPPYAERPAEVLRLLSASTRLAPGALVALEAASAGLPAEGLPGGERLAVRAIKRYGDSAIVYADHLAAIGSEGSPA
jgi:16S rRNA (guanine966-N2)-methyltransferase